MNSIETSKLTNEEYSYGYIIEVLTGGLYHDKFHVIREYIQNGYDAINMYQKEFGDQQEDFEIKVLYQKPSIFIIDNGIGMDRDKINQYRKIGYSEKLIDQQVGFRGIGKLSGLSVAEKLIVTSKQKGSQERHKIIFDANSMLKEIISLKTVGRNVPLNTLIPKYTEIITEIDDSRDSHFTIVELFNIREDSKLLFTKENMEEYISLNCPVRFNPNFEYAKEIEERLSSYVKDYGVMPITLDGIEIYKSYLNNCKSPNFITVWGDDEEETDYPIAYCWYCENANKGQFEDKNYSGLVYKYKNFTVGDKNLTRNTLWRSSPERAFYFLGEVFVNLIGILPSSERSNFEHNEKRDLLYNKCQIIPKELNKIALSSSNKHRAIEKLNEGEKKIEEVSKTVNDKKLPVEIHFDKAVEIFNVVSDLEERVKHLPDNIKPKAGDLIEKGKSILKILNNNETKEVNNTVVTKPVASNGINNEVTYDIKKKLSLEPQASILYDLIINVLKDHYIDDVNKLEVLLAKIHRALEENLYKD